jgi:hypothetical protein
MTTPKALLGREPLFKTMFGSRLYGTNTPISDIDWKEVFLPALDNLLIGKKPTNVVVSTGGDKTRNTKDDIDNEYIPIQVFANDFIGGQTYAIEMAFAVLSAKQEAGQQLYSSMFKFFVWELTETFLTSNIKAMVGYAMNQAQIYGIKGTRLASIRKLKSKLSDMIKQGEIGNGDRLENLQPWLAANSDKYLFETTFEHMDVKKPALSILEKLYPFTITIGEAIERTDTLIAKYGSRAHDAESAEGMDWKATAHAVRITKQAIRILNDHKMEFPFDKAEVDFLLSIKHGEKTPQEVEVILTNLFVELDEAKETTKLPNRTDEMDDAFERWLKGWMKTFYTSQAV